MFISKELLNFITVARVKSLSRASEELFITQSPICRSLKRLENSLGVKLFYRSGSGLTLTEDGMYLYNIASELCTQLFELEDVIKKQKNS